MKTSLDKRITKKISILRAAEEAKKIQAADNERLIKEKHLKNIETKMPEARAFVEKYMLDAIAKMEFAGKKSLSVPDGWRNPFDYNDQNMLPPVESLVQALKEIKGLEIKSTWVPEWTGHLNSDEVMETIEAHYSYEVTWK